MYSGDYVYMGGELVDAASAAPFVAHHFLLKRFRDDCREEAKKQWAYEELVTDHEDRVYDQGFASEDTPAEFIKWLGEKYDLTPAGSGWGSMLPAPSR